MSQLGPSSDEEKPEVLLRRFFEQHGYVRVANVILREQMKQFYHKGYEVRLVVKTESELAFVRQLLTQIGFKAGKPFQKHNRIVQPVYGKSAVEWFSPTTLNENEGRSRRRKPR